MANLHRGKAGLAEELVLSLPCHDRVVQSSPHVDGKRDLYG